MTEKKTASDEPSQEMLDATLEDLCDQLAEKRASHATLIRAIHRDKADIPALRRLTGLTAEKLVIERGAAYKALLDIVLQGALGKWSTPGEHDHPRIGEGMVAFNARVKAEKKSKGKTDGAPAGDKADK